MDWPSVRLVGAYSVPGLRLIVPAKRSRTFNRANLPEFRTGWVETSTIRGRREALIRLL
jgi:hypothetical protein